MAYHVASTDQDQARYTSSIIGGRLTRSAAPEAPGPLGTCHSVEDGAKETVCGLTVGTLYDYPDLLWPPARGLDRCLFCRQWTPADAGQI